jgi:hypothetical protein
LGRGKKERRARPQCATAHTQCLGRAGRSEMPHWLKRTNVWRKVTSPRTGPMRLRSGKSPFDPWRKMNILHPYKARWLLATALAVGIVSYLATYARAETPCVSLICTIHPVCTVYNPAPVDANIRAAPWGKILDTVANSTLHEGANSGPYAIVMEHNRKWARVIIRYAFYDYQNQTPVLTTVVKQGWVWLNYLKCNT